MSGCKSEEEREFYVRLAIKERYSKRQLERQMDSGYLSYGYDPENSDDVAYQMLKETVEANSDYDFFIFATADGDEDGAGVMMTEQVVNFLGQENPVFSYGLDPEVNNFYFTRSAFDHNDIWMPYTLYNALPLIFNGELVK